MVLPFFFYPGLAFCDTDQYPCTLSAAYGQHWRHIKPFYHCPHGCTILQHLDGLATSGSFKCHLAHQIVPNPQNRSKKTWFRCILIEFLYAHDRSVTLIWIWFWGNTKHKWENSFWLIKSVLLEQSHKIYHSKIHCTIFTIYAQSPTFLKNTWKFCSFIFLSSALWHSNAYTRKQYVDKFVYD